MYRIIIVDAANVFMGHVDSFSHSSVYVHLKAFQTKHTNPLPLN